MDPSTTAGAVMSIQSRSRPTSTVGPPSQDNVSQLKQRILELERKLQGRYNNYYNDCSEISISFWVYYPYISGSGL
jgi:beta-lactamase class A